jgi:outer membrane protein assembly factor BamB
MNWSFKADNWFWAAPVVQSSTVYAASLDHKVYAVDAASGQPKWQHPFDAGAPVRSTPVIAGGGLLVATRAGSVYKLSLDDGQPQGSPVVAGTQIDANLTADSGNMVYVSPTQAVLYVVNAAGPLESPASYPLP